MNILRPVAILTAALALSSIAIGPASAQQQQKAAQKPEPSASVSDPALLPDQELGRRFVVKAQDLPPPKSGPIVASRSLTLPYQGQTPRAPEGFTVTPFVTGLEHARRLLVLPNGDVIVAEQRVGHLTLLRDEDGDGRAEWIQRHAEGFNQPYGLAWRDGHVLVADQDGIWQVPHLLTRLRPGAPGVQQKVSEVPPGERKPTPSQAGEKMVTKKGVFGLVSGHANRPLAIDPKTGALFVGVGSAGNIGVEPEVKASIQRFDADGTNQTTFASGLRNPTALAFAPGSGDLYTVVQERDGLGDKLPPDFLARVEKGAFYGWPYCLYRSAPAARVRAAAARQGEGVG